MKTRTQMNLQRQLFPILALLLFMFGCGDNPPNSPPEIVDIITYPAAPKAGQEVLITAIIEDEEGDDVLFRWMASGGEFLDSLGSNPISWRSPADTGTISIYLEVEDIESQVSETHQFTLLEGIGTVAGHVKDQATGYHLPGVLVKVGDAEYTTSTDGYFIFDEVKTGTNIPMSAEANNYVTHAALIDVVVDENIVDIDMTVQTEVGRIAGYVSDAVSGERLEGVLVQTGSIEALSGDDGYYELYNVPISSNVPLRARMEGYVIFADLLSVVGGYNAKDIALEPGLATVSGRVTSSSDGSLLEGAIVTLNDIVDSTNVAGYYQLDLVPIGSNATLTVTADGYVNSYAIIDVVGGSNVVDIQLSDNSATLSGWVRSTLDGSLIAGAALSLGGQETITDGEGYYNIPGIDPGSHLLNCSAVNFASHSEVLEIAAGNNRLDLNLSPSVGNLSGYVSHSVTGTMLSSIVVNLGSESTLTSETGYFQFLNQALGDNVLTIIEDGYQEVSDLVTIVAGNSMHNISLLPNTGDLVGIVRDAVTASALGGVFVTNGEASDTTETDGTFVLENLTLDAHTITFSKPHYAEYQILESVDLGENLLTVDLTPTSGSVSGLITDVVSGLPMGDVLISLGDSTATTDSQGRFTWNHMPVGIYDFSTSAENYANLDDLVTIDLGENILNYQMSYTLADLEGFVYEIGTSIPLDSVQIIFQNDTTFTDSNGIYAFEAIQIGNDFLIQAMRSGYHALNGRVDIVAGTNISDMGLIAESE